MALFLAGVRVSTYSVSFHCLMAVFLILQVSVAGLRRRRQQGAISNDAEVADLQTELRAHWLCNAPKPQLVYLADEHNDLLETELIWIPPAVVLHRCVKTLGCCARYPQEKCQPQEEEQVQVLFKKISPTRAPEFQRLTFTNHTKCTCKPPS